MVWKAREIFTAINDRDGLARVYVQLGRLCLRHGAFRNAAEPLLCALSIALDIDSLVAGGVLHSLVELDAAVGRPQFRKICRRACRARSAAHPRPLRRRTRGWR
jgi:uncharacterized protein HemY